MVSFPTTTNWSAAEVGRQATVPKVPAWSRGHGQTSCWLMDVRMPSVDGIGSTGHLTSTMDWTPKIIVMTMFEKDD